MRKVWLILAVVVLGAGTFLLFNKRAEPNEPTYDGRSLSYWLTELKNNHREERYDGHTMAYWMTGNADPKAPYWDNTNAAGNVAEAAIQVIGTNALPHLIDRIKSRPGRAGQMAESFGKKIHMPPRSIQEANQRADEAVYAFGFLGSNAWPAIGILSNMVCNPDSYLVAGDATDALICLGQPGVKTLASIMTETSVRWRTTIAFHIVVCRPQDRKMAIAALTSLTNSPDKRLRDVCAMNLKLMTRRGPPSSILRPRNQVH